MKFIIINIISNRDHDHENLHHSINSSKLNYIITLPHPPFIVLNGPELEGRGPHPPLTLRFEVRFLCVRL